MENFSKEILSVLQYLLPGFVASWVFYGLTPFPKPSQFERVIQALIYTIFIHAIVNIFMELFLFVGTNYFIIMKWNETVSLLWSIIIALFIGIGFSWLGNNDKMHQCLRKLGITNETSFPSELIGTFASGKSTYVVLHFNDERRLYGWVNSWPSKPLNDHYVKIEPVWLSIEEKLDGIEAKETGVEKVLINANDIKWVEFMKSKESKNV